MSIMVDKPDGIKFFQMGARRGALSMEIAGIRKRGQSAYSICKEVYGLTGSRESVLAQMEFMVEGAIAWKHGVDEAQVKEILKGHETKNRKAFMYGYSGEWVNAR